MLAVHVILFFFSLPLHEARLSYQYPNNTYFQTCVNDIIKNYFHKPKEITIVDMRTENEEIFKIINNVKINSIILKESTDIRLRALNYGYFIAAGSYIDFMNNFPNLTNQRYWNPSARILIMIKDLKSFSLERIFDLLLTQNVINVLVMDESADPNLYTYNPFENFGCGRRYDRIIEYGKCSMSRENLYPYKLVTGLRNCTFKVASPHWPPYSMDLAKKNSPIGVEQKILILISKLEQFQVDFVYSGDGEEFSLKKNDSANAGPLYMLQKREIQMMAGGVLLTHPRAREFSYIWGHLAYTEEISYQVKKATTIATWKNTFLEFEPIVWTVFILAFLVFLFIFIVFVRPRDKGRIVLKMIGFLILAGGRIRGNFFTRYLFFHWVLFAYIINVYYVSIMVSFTTNPITNYQVSTEEDLVKYNLKPCVNRAIKNYLASVEANESFYENRHKGCENLFESIRMVSESNELYTVVFRSIYKYHKHSYIDKWGVSTIYTFNEPLTKAIYAIYLYKGFPMLEKLHIQTLRLRENGFVDRYLKYLYGEQGKKYHFDTKKQRFYVIVPWYILLFGYLLSVVVFAIEIIVKKFFSQR